MLIALFERSSQSQSGRGALPLCFPAPNWRSATLSLFSRWAGFRHGAVKTVLTGLGVWIDEVNRSIDDLIRAERHPVDEIGRSFNMEPCAIRARSVHMERMIGQNAAGCARAVAVNNDCRRQRRKTDDVIRIWLELENHSAGDIGRSVIDRYDRNLRTAFAGWNGD